MRIQRFKGRGLALSMYVRRFFGFRFILVGLSPCTRILHINIDTWHADITCIITIIIIASYRISSYCITLRRPHGTALNCTAFHCITLHYISLYYITSQYVHYNIYEFEFYFTGFNARPVALWGSLTARHLDFQSFSSTMVSTAKWISPSDIFGYVWCIARLFTSPQYTVYDVYINTWLCVKPTPNLPHIYNSG